jgi:hypothetical protein
MLSAQDIIAENALHAAKTPWIVADRVGADGVRYNGHVDDTLQDPARIQGYATKPSYNVGQPVDFKIDCESSYDVYIYRLGWYGVTTTAGITGARLVASLHHEGGSSQDSLLRTTYDSLGRAIDTSRWETTVTWEPTFDGTKYVYTSPDDGAGAQPKKLISGVYYAVLARLDLQNPSNQSYSSIVFVLRDDAGKSDILMQSADTTWQAYNTFGGKSLYFDKATPGNSGSRAVKVSYDRPQAWVQPLMLEERSAI